MLAANNNILRSGYPNQRPRCPNCSSYNIVQRTFGENIVGVFHCKACNRALPTTSTTNSINFATNQYSHHQAFATENAGSANVNVTTHIEAVRLKSTGGSPMEQTPSLQTEGYDVVMEDGEAYHICLGTHEAKVDDEAIENTSHSQDNLPMSQELIAAETQLAYMCLYPDAVMLECSKSLPASSVDTDEMDGMLLRGGIKPTPHQLEVFRFIKNPEGRHAVVTAVAGSGKTSTLVKMCELVPPNKSCIFLAYNKAVQEYVKAFLPARIVNQTTHGCALAAVNAYLAKKRRTIQVLDWYEEFPLELCPSGLNEKKLLRWRSILRKGLSICENVSASTQDEIETAILSSTYGLEPEIFEDEYDCETIAEYILKAMAHLKQQCMEPKGGCKKIVCNHDDYLWLSIALGSEVTFPQFDFVFVDETQDLNATQLSLVRRLVEKSNGRIIAVGDERQALYGFRGADTQAIQRIREELEAEPFALTVSWRCPKRIVLLAQTVVAEIEAAPDAIDGTIRYLPQSGISSRLQNGDFVLSRTNTALQILTMDLIQSGKRVMIKGLEIKKQLVGYVNSCPKGLPLEMHLHNKLQLISYLFDQEKISEQEYIATTEMLSYVRSLYYKCNYVIPEMFRRLDEMIADDRDDLDESKLIVLSSVHRAKGLERPKVHVLRWTFLDGRGDKEEDNIWYVAITRAQSELVICGEKRPLLSASSSLVDSLFQSGSCVCQPVEPEIAVVGPYLNDPSTAVNFIENETDEGFLPWMSCEEEGDEEVSAPTVSIKSEMSSTHFTNVAGLHQTGIKQEPQNHPI